MDYAAYVSGIMPLLYEVRSGLHRQSGPESLRAVAERGDSPMVTAWRCGRRRAVRIGSVRWVSHNPLDTRREERHGSAGR